jgi:mRNA interferase MazF
LRTIDKRRLKEKITFLDQEIMVRVDEALKISLGLTVF